MMMAILKNLLAISLLGFCWPMILDAQSEEGADPVIMYLKERSDFKG